MKNYIVVGLTGQSGAGKTTVSDVFAKNNFAIIDCDKVAREVTNDGSECNSRLAKIFQTCFDENYSLNRKALASIVFNDSDKLKLLNDTIFPFITADIKSHIEGFVRKGETFILLDAPTLFDAGADKLCDLIVSCIANEQIRWERIRARDNITDDQIKSRFSSQRDDMFFMENSDYIIINNESIADATKQTENIINKIKGKLNG